MKTSENTWVYMHNHLLEALDYLNAVKYRVMNQCDLEDFDYPIDKIRDAIRLIPFCSYCGTDLYGRHLYQKGDVKLCDLCHEKTQQQIGGFPNAK